ncbi:MAG: hypothetical protein ABWK01_03515 [Infirmifilum sp.]
MLRPYTSIIIAKYLVMNSLNPLLRRLAGRIAIFSLLSLLVFLLAIPLLTPKNSASYPEWVLTLKLSRSYLTDVTSATLTLTFLLTLVRGRREIAASEEAEHELLLALPVTMSDYLLGKTLYFALQTLFYTIPLVFMAVPLLYSMVGFDVIRPIFLIISLVLAAVYSETVIMLATLLRITSTRQGLPELAGYSYLATSLLHSAIIRQVSPLLVWPAVPAVKPIIDVFSRHVSPQELGLEALLLAGSVILLVVIFYVFSGRIHAEYVRPLHEILRDIGAKRRKPLSLKDLSPGDAVRKVVVSLSVGSRNHLILVILGFTLAASVAAVLRHLGLQIDALTLSSFGVVFLASEATIASAFTVQRDLSHLWLYKTTPASLKPLTRALLLKTTIYLTEAFMVVSIFRAFYSLDPVWLLVPISSLPVILFTALAILAFLVRIASSRRLVRYSSRGFYMVEDIVATGIMGLATLMAIVDLTLYELMVEYSPNLWWPIYLSLASLAASLILTRVAEDMLYRQLWYTDLR